MQIYLSKFSLQTAPNISYQQEWSKPPLSVDFFKKLDWHSLIKYQLK